MLNLIPKNLSPDLVRALMMLGHGDEVVLADANFPSIAWGGTVIRADGLLIPDLLASILQLMPLDHYRDEQWALMHTIGDDPTPPIWAVYSEIIAAADPHAVKTHLERFSFYERARSAGVTVITSDTSLYGNIIVSKGVVTGA